MSIMKRWLREKGITYRKLAEVLNQTDANISEKVNGNTAWQQHDLVMLHRVYGLSSDYVLGLTTRDVSETNIPEDQRTPVMS
jgi:plasmid maintenance system antidote protein VapI